MIGLRAPHLRNAERPIADRRPVFIGLDTATSPDFATVGIVTIGREGRPLTAALVYRSGDRCPACWGTHFFVGRTTAECATCGMALALDARDARP